MSAESAFTVRAFCLTLSLICALPGATVAQTKAGDDIAALSDAAQAAYDRGQYASAITAWRNLIPLLQKTNDARAAGDVSFHIGLAYNALAEYAKARVSFEEALAIHRLIKYRAGESYDLSGIGVAAMHLGQYADALAAQQQTLAIARELSDRSGEATDLGNIGVVERLLGRYDEALASQRQALAIQRARADRSGEAGTLGNIGLIERDLGRYQDALASQQEALAMHRVLEDRAEIAGDLCNLGTVQEALGHYDDALASERQALAIDREIGDRPGATEVLTNLGNLEADLGRFDVALDLHAQALGLARELDYPVEEAAEFANIGTIELDLGRADSALAAFRQALAIERGIGNRQGIADILGNIGNAESDLGHGDDALEAHREALALDREIKSSAGEAANLGNIGNDLIGLGRYSEALAAHGQALALYRASEDKHGIVNELGNVAAVDENLGRHAEALASAREAEGLDEQLRDPQLAWRSLRLAARAEAHLDRRDAALADYASTLDLIEGLRSRLRSGERGAFLGTAFIVYDEYIAYLVELNARFPNQGYDRKAFEILERKSARAVLEQVGWSAAHHFRGIPADVVAGDESATAGVFAALGRLTSLLSAQRPDPAGLAAAQKDVASAKALASEVEAAIEARYPAYYALRHPQPVQLEALQRSVLRPGELLLAYAELDDESVLWLIDSQHMRMLPLAGGREIAGAVARLGAHVTGMLTPGMREAKLERSAAADIPPFAADSYALYKMLVPADAASAVAHAKSLIVVPSNDLYRLAFETLVTRDPAQGAQPHYLIEDVPISYLPSASLLGVVRASYAQRTPDRNPLLAFANPAFGTSASPAAKARGASTYADLQLAAVRSAFVRGATPSGLADAVFPELPGTQTEADAVRSAVGASEASLMLGDRATRERLLGLNADGSLKTYQYLLFATHAVLPSEITGLTQPAIVLAHPERGDGLLTMGDVFDLSLDADFVMLSACNTGVATANSSGEGISGLTRAFLYAGTPAISVTLWEVDDAAAPQITPAFFAGMYTGRLSPAESLRKAKLTMLKSPQARFRHPYAWAPSVIFGDGDRS